MCLPVSIRRLAAAFCLIYIFALWIPVQASAEPEPAQKKQNEITHTTSEDIWAKTLGGSNFSEFWNYQIYLDNGMSLYIIFSVSDVSPLSSAVSGLRVSMYGLDGKKYNISREYPIENLEQDKAEHKFSLNPRQDNIWFKGELPNSHEIYINTAKDGHRYDIHLKFEDIQPGIKVGENMFDISGEQIGIITHIPFARVSGHAGINDNVKDVKGTAYMDHTFQNQSSMRLLQSGFRFIQHTSKDAWELTYFLQPQKEGDTVGYHLSSENGHVKANQVRVGTDISRYARSNREYPEEFNAQLDDGRALKFSDKKEIERRSIFADLSWLARNAVKALIGGDLTDHRGKGKMCIDDAPVKAGHFNYFIVR